MSLLVLNARRHRHLIYTFEHRARPGMVARMMLTLVLQARTRRESSSMSWWTRKTENAHTVHRNRVTFAPSCAAALAASLSPLRLFKRGLEGGESKLAASAFGFVSPSDQCLANAQLCSSSACTWAIRDATITYMHQRVLASHNDSHFSLFLLRSSLASPLPRGI